MNEHWIPITYEDDTAQKLEAAVAACYSVHTFTLRTLNAHFRKCAESLALGDFKAQLSEFLILARKGAVAQHYSLTKAAEKTFPHFSEHKKINHEGKFVAVKPIPRKQYREIQIEKRQVWRKYLALNSLITTAYGTLYLDKDQWPQILAEQAAAKGIPFDTVPFLWHSAVIHIDAENARVRFNLHVPDSKFGRRAKKGMKKVV